MVLHLIEHEAESDRLFRIAVLVGDLQNRLVGR